MERILEETDEIVALYVAKEFSFATIEGFTVCVDDGDVKSDQRVCTYFLQEYREQPDHLVTEQLLALDRGDALGDAEVVAGWGNGTGIAE